MGARVLFIWSFVLLYSQKIGGDFTVRSLRSRGGEIPAFAHSARVFEHVSTTKTTHSTSILRLVAQHLLLQMHSMSITPEWYSGAFSRKSTFLKIPISFTPLILCLLPPRDEREKTEWTPTQLPANKKCCLLIFAIAIGCLVLADFPASFPPFSFLSAVMLCRVL